VDYFSKLGDIKLGEDLKWQDEKVLIKIGELYGKFDDLLLNFAVDVFTGGIKGEIKGEVTELLSKIDGVSDKASDYLLKLDDPALQKLLIGALDAFSFSWGELVANLGGGNQNPDITLEKTDDVITEG
jgi:hypothetical protein